MTTSLTIFGGSNGRSNCSCAIHVLVVQWWHGGWWHFFCEDALRINFCMRAIVCRPRGPLLRMYRLTSSTIAIASIYFNFTLPTSKWNYEINFNRSDVVDAFMPASATATALSCSFVLPQVLIVQQRPWWNHLRARVTSSHDVLFNSYLVNPLA